MFNKLVAISVVVLGVIIVGTSGRRYYKSQVQEQVPYFGENPIDPVSQDAKFFRRILPLRLTPLEIYSSFKNVSAEVSTARCKGICRSTAALWVLQDLTHCDSIDRADCPIGLLCCKFDLVAEKKRIILDQYNDGSQNEFQTKDASGKPLLVPYSVLGDDGKYYPEPILDPIPGED